MLKRLVNIFINVSTRHAGWVILSGAVLTLFSLIYAYGNLTFDTNQDHLIDPNADYFRDYSDFLKQFGDWEYIYVVVKVNGKPFDAKRLAGELGRRLRRRPDLFAKVTERLPVDALANRALLLLPETEFAEIEKSLTTFAPQLADFLAVGGSAGWYAWVDRLLADDPARFSEGMERFWPLFTAALSAPFDATSLAKLDTAGLAAVFTNRYIDPDGYLFSSDGKLLFVTALPGKNYSRLDIVREPLDYLRAELESLRKKYPGLEFGVTGRPVLQDDEAVSTGNDSVLASLGSVALIVLLFVIFVRDRALTLMSLLALLAGIAVTTALITGAFGSVNLLTIVFAIILIGMGMDYGIHFMLHYHVLRDSGLPVHEAIRESLSEDGEAILMAAGLTALGFGTAVFTDFLGLQQLGLIIAAGIVICCIAQLTLFPALITVCSRHGESRGDILKRFKPVIRLTAALSSLPRAVMIVTMLAGLAVIPLAVGIGFDYNLLNLQDPKQESVIYERVITTESDQSTWFLAVTTPDIAELERLAEKIAALPSVARVESVLDIVPVDQQNRRQRLAALKTLLLPAPTSTAGAGPGTALADLSRRFADLSARAFSAGNVEAVRIFEEQSATLDGFAKSLEASPFFSPPLDEEFCARLDELKKLFRGMLDPEPITEADLPADLLSRYKSASGLYSLTVYPRENVWEWEFLRRFIAEVRSVAPSATGAPVTTYESALRMQKGFIQIGALTAALVFFLLIAAFREIVAPLMIVLKLALTFWLLFAFMGAVGISINLANFFALPILIGSNVDHGVYFLHHYRQHRDFTRLFQLTVPPVLLSCLTNIVGFAALALVRHRGLAGFGLVMSVGTMISLIVTLTWLPAVMRLFPGTRAPRGAKNILQRHKSL